MEDQYLSQFSPNISHPYYIIRTHLNKAILKHSKLLTGKLMDLGCGSKPYLNYFSHVEKYVGVDYQGEGHSHENENIDFFYDGKTLPFSDNTFDSVLCTEVFEHIFNLEEIIIETNRVMKPGANILITLPFVWNEHEAPNDFARYSSFGIKDLMQRNGFEIIIQEKTANFFQTLVQLSLLYFDCYVISKFSFFKPLHFLIRRIFCTFWNLIGLGFSFVLPKRNDLYLNNILVCRKK